MNTLIDKPANADSRILKVSVLSADQLKNHVAQPAAPCLPPQDDHQVDNGRSLQDVMQAICEDCCKNSLTYVARSDTGHDGE